MDSLIKLIPWMVLAYVGWDGYNIYERHSEKEDGSSRTGRNYKEKNKKK